ncbi:MAG: DUF58 domain-containing protein [Candidatus Saccharibacteria bacterium]|nr:DUF58 domain-containing protein [Candidatus Saccharibacteria bacterium]
MKLSYINQIKANISIYSDKKTTNILDGTYKSIYRGKSMNFENLREYVLGDDVKDIDWKSSARSGKILTKQFIAEKKHNILLVMDTGVKMEADSDALESKKDLALFAAGTVGYLAIKNNDYVGMLYATDKKIELKPFRYNLYNLEDYLVGYERNVAKAGAPLNDVLEFANKYVAKRMIIIIVTDLAGINSIETNTLKRLNQRHNVLAINITDNYMFGSNIFDVTNDEYIPDFLLGDKKLNKLEHELRRGILDKNRKRLRRNRVCMTSISKKEEISYRVIELLEEHRHASTN